MQLLRRLRGVHVRPLLRALPGLQVRSHPRPRCSDEDTGRRNAEALNKSGLLCCVLGCFFPCVPALLLRNEARDKYNIEVTISQFTMTIVLSTNLHNHEEGPC